MKNPNRLLKKIRIYSNKNIREILKNQKETIVPPIPKKKLPTNSLLRGLYNEMYYNHYQGFSYSSLSLGLIFIERISREIYKKHIPNGKSKEWANILSELKSHFNKTSHKQAKQINQLLEDLDHFRDKIRNLILHGKIEEYLKDITIEYSKAYNVFTMQTETIKMKYHPSINYDQRMKLLFQKMTLDTQSLVVLISIVFEHFGYLFEDTF